MEIFHYHPRDQGARAHSFSALIRLPLAGLPMAREEDAVRGFTVATEEEWSAHSNT